jgi:hypothetical protein
MQPSREQTVAGDLAASHMAASRTAVNDRAASHTPLAYSRPVTRPLASMRPMVADAKADPPDARGIEADAERKTCPMPDTMMPNPQSRTPALHVAWHPVAGIGQRQFCILASCMSSSTVESMVQLAAMEMPNYGLISRSHYGLPRFCIERLKSSMFCWKIRWFCS